MSSSRILIAHSLSLPRNHVSLTFICCYGMTSCESGLAPYVASSGVREVDDNERNQYRDRNREGDSEGLKELIHRLIPSILLSFPTE